MTEFELIARLTKDLPTNGQVLIGAGDDCAVLDLGISDNLLLFKTDAVVEGVHFLAETEAKKIGRKALGRCFSDVAAMAGTPTAALVTLGLPKGFDVPRVEGIYEGLNSLAREFSVAVVGGETTRAAEMFVSVAVLGTAPRGRVIRRNGAKVGDAIFVSGVLGGSLHSGWHLDFLPRLKEGRWLAENFSVHAMMDVSDGVAGDLRHILEASGVGAELLASAVPISRAAKLRAQEESSAKPPLLAALTDGEDFELLFTVSAKDAVRLADGWKKMFPDVKLSCIGKVTAEDGLRLRDKNGLKPAPYGYAHFGKS